jgi:hypothetical protein
VLLSIKSFVLHSKRKKGCRAWHDEGQVCVDMLYKLIQVGDMPEK